MTRSSVRGVVVFVVVSFVLAWAVALPLYFTGGLASPLMLVVPVVMMFVPAGAALLVARFVDRPASIPRSLGLWPLRPVRRLLGYLALGFAIPLAIVLVALPVGQLFGVYQADYVGLAAFRELMESQPGGPAPLPVPVILVIQFASILVGGILNIVPAAGEEVGWRGYLLPKLLPLGTVPAIVISGVVWGAWHAPLLLLGYNYPGAPGWLAVLAMCGTCVVVGGLFGWLRLRSQSVWPAAFAHGTFNASAGLAFVFSASAEQPDMTQATILGWTGWIVPLVVVAVLVATRSFRPSPSPTPAA